MRRLNLDIFSSSGDVTSEPPQTVAKAANAPIQAESGEGVQVSPADHSDPASHKRLTTKFIPVGFHEEHLRLLDEAVLRLRRRGEWQASKSGLIRRLIELHKDDLEQVYLGGSGDG